MYVLLISIFFFFFAVNILLITYLQQLPTSTGYTVKETLKLSAFIIARDSLLELADKNAFAEIFPGLLTLVYDLYQVNYISPPHLMHRFFFLAFPPPVNLFANLIFLG